MQDIERRVVPTSVELRATKDGKPKTLVGYGAMFGARSSDLGGFVEEIAPGAFDATLASSDDVLARAEHDSRMLLGRRSSGTLRLKADATGLRYEVDLPDTTVGRDLAVLVERGDVKASSFAFVVEDRAKDEEWSTTPEGVPLRTVKRVTLVDVAPVANPAYPQTTVSARALDTAKAMVPAMPMGGKMPKEMPAQTPKKKAKKGARIAAIEAVKRGFIRRVGSVEAWRALSVAEQRDASFEEKLEALWMGLCDLLGDCCLGMWHCCCMDFDGCCECCEDGPCPCESGMRACWYVEATFDDHVIIERGYQLLSYPYTWGQDGAPVFGDPTVVHVTYPPVPGAMPADMGEGDMGGEEGMAMRGASERSASGASDLPIADRERAWDATAAEGHVRNWASQDHSGDKSEVDWAKYGKGFFWHGENAASFGAFKLGFADVIGGQLTAIPRAIFACAAVIQGGRGGVDIPEGELDAVKARIAGYYRRMREKFGDSGIVAPWERAAAQADLEMERLRGEMLG